MTYTYPARRFLKDPDFPLQVRKAKQRKEEPPHTHEFVEVVYVAGGRAQHWLRYTGGEGSEGRASQTEHYRISAGDVFVIAPGEEHDYDRADSLEIYNVLFMPVILREFFARLRRMEALLKFIVTEPLFRSEARFRHKLHLSPPESLRVKECLDVVLEEVDAARPGYKLLARNRLAEFLVLLGRAYEKQGAASESFSDLAGKHASVEKAIAFMEAQFAESLSLEEIAHQCFLSPHYFCRLFGEKVGISPWEYLTKVRLEEAKKQLATTDDSVTIIALRTGFCDSSHLARAFRVHEGITPSEYRRTTR